jgi:hypothetical protein
VVGVVGVSAEVDVLFCPPVVLVWLAVEDVWGWVVDETVEEVAVVEEVVVVDAEVVVVTTVVVVVLSCPAAPSDPEATATTTTEPTAA